LDTAALQLIEGLDEMDEEIDTSLETVCELNVDCEAENELKGDMESCELELADALEKDDAVIVAS
jgi:hypothetical protein